jgi:transcriptional regulator with XRE-family HTH domain
MENSAIDFKKIVGKQVRKLRLKAGLTQDVLSERCGIYRTYLSRIEAGSANPTLLVLIALASTLDVHVCEFFHDFDDAAKDTLAVLTSQQNRF